MRIGRLLQWFLPCAIVLVLTACGVSERTVAPANANTIRVGAMIGGSEAQLLEVAKKTVATKYDLDIQVIPYAYAKQLNKALSDHEIDANIFQYRAYLEHSQQKHGYSFSVVADTYIYPMAVYSKKITNILQIEQGAVIAIPNEPTNEARALFLLEKAGLIRMKSDEDMEATVADIASNPSGFEFRELSGNKLPSVLPNVDIAVINAGFAVSAGLMPSQHALVVENENSAYANLLVVRQGEENDPRVRALVEILHSAEVERGANEIFQGQAIPAWK